MVALLTTCSVAQAEPSLDPSAKPAAHATSSDSKPQQTVKANDPQSVERARTLQHLGAHPVAIEKVCLDAKCRNRALEPTLRRLRAVEAGDSTVVRLLVLGDSHIAADYIVRTTRGLLQKRFGDGGRGFTAIDQKRGFGGRRLARDGFGRTRVVDLHGAHRPYGFAGMAITSSRKNARVDFFLRAKDRRVSIYYYAHPKGPEFRTYLSGKPAESFSTRASVGTTRVVDLHIPRRNPSFKNLRIQSRGRHGKLFGVSFETESPGIILEAVGPVGADAEAYLDLDSTSFRQHLQLADPDMVILFLGGNDALKVRTRKKKLSQIQREYQQLTAELRAHLPESDCLVVSPLDAGRSTPNRRVRSQRFIREVRDLQRSVASQAGCGFWDAYESMGGEGSFAAWHRRGLMNDDLVHPRKQGGTLLGHLFAEALLNAYTATP
jgi:lysophospholipase L1-like esterase